MTVRGASSLTETNTMPETSFTITQGTLTITEAGNAIPYSGKLEALSKFSTQQVVMKPLKRDRDKTLDALCHAQFNATPLRVVGTSTAAVALTTNGTATATNSVAFNSSHHKAIIDVMKERNIPAYSGDDYMALAWPTTLRTFKTIWKPSTNTPGRSANDLPGEIGRYENCRYVEQTNIPKGGAANSTTWNAYTNTADVWDNVPLRLDFLLRRGHRGGSHRGSEEIRAKIPTDYGRSKGSPGITWVGLAW